MNELVFWITMAVTAGLVTWIVLKLAAKHQKAQAFRKTIAKGDLVKAIIPDAANGITCQIVEVRHDNLKSVVVTITTTEDCLFPII
jgi:hypothetical protein